jgi:hypothetical protein
MLWLSIPEEIVKAKTMKETQYLIHQHIMCKRRTVQKYKDTQYDIFFYFYYCHAIAPLRQKDEPACCINLASSERDT